MSQTTPSRQRTEQRILDKADELFHAFGAYKTTVADIARELDMSPANIYKFFPSKDAIVQTVGARNLKTVKENIATDISKTKDATKKLEALVLVIYRFHRQILRNEKNIYPMMVAAHDKKWGCAVDFKQFLRDTLGQILSDGINTGQFQSLDVPATCGILMDSLNWIINPVLLYEIDDGRVENQLHSQVQFLARAMRKE